MLKESYVIETRNLGKKYSISSTSSLSSKEKQNSSLFAFFKSRVKHIHWALKDINIEIERGTIVAIMGHNGSGKSTLLRLLSEITEPTEGEIIIRGSISSMLEAGVGFHPELTGRENIFLNGSIIGMSRKEIDNQFEEIVTFSEIDLYLDTPLKRYSSGMVARLAFAVASHLNRDVLIVDEVLSISDNAFREKAIVKLKQLANDGVAILVVSHDIDLLKKLCNKAFLLKSGKLIEKGDFKNICSQYSMAQLDKILAD